VRRAWLAGITTLSVTDHDTTAATGPVAEAAARLGITTIAGIEITAVHEGRDVHVLGYFLDPGEPGLVRFLEDQRRDRIRRIGRMIERLAELGRPLEVSTVLPEGEAVTGRAVGRPHVARALLQAGHVASIGEAFDLWIGEGKPAFVPRCGASPAEVVGVIRRAGGLASLAHPGLLGRDDLIAGLVADGLGAVEAYHCDHPPHVERRYEKLARRLNLAVTGGSDYHGEAAGRPRVLGVTVLPQERFDELRRRVGG
jgi:predicted metal-dependent phosphoesterase TrpH